MKKTVSINLNNQVFVIEEIGYDKLSKYLEQIKVHCGSDVDVNEVIKDIEASMAEKLKAGLNDYKQVVTEVDVDELIKVMGTIDDFVRESGEGNSTDTSTKRRLYRDTDNAIVAGVAAGLSNYFDIDPVIIRVLFVASLFVGGFGFIMYVILWLAMPEAKTAQQKMEMHGQTPSLAAFENIAKSSKTIAEKWRTSSGYKKIINFPFLVAKQIFSVLKQIIEKSLILFRVVFGLFLLLFSLFVIGLVGVGFVFFVLQDQSLYSISNIPVADIVKVLPLTWLAVSGFLTVIIPLIVLFFAGLMLIRKKAILNFISLMVMLAIWMFAGMVFVGTTLRYIPEIQSVFKNHVNTQISERQLTDTQSIKSIVLTGPNLDVDIEFVKEAGVRLVGKNGELNKIDIKIEAEKIIINNNKDNNDFCINCSQQKIKLLVSQDYKDAIEIDSRARVNFVKGEVENLNVILNNNARVMLTGLTTNFLTVNLSNDSYLTTKGNYKNIKIIANESTFICQKCKSELLNINSNDSLIILSGEANELVYKGVSTEDDNILNIAKLIVDKSQLETIGSSALVLGDQQEVKFVLSESTNVFTVDETKINKGLNEKNIIRYKKISQQEYYDLMEKTNSQEGVLNVNGDYYLLIKNKYNQENLDQLKQSFEEAVS